MLTLLPVVFGFFGAIYAVFAAGLGAAFIMLALRLQRRADRKSALRTYLFSLAYLAVLFAAMVAGRPPVDSPPDGSHASPAATSAPPTSPRIIGLLMFALTFVAALRLQLMSELDDNGTVPPVGEEIHMPAPSILPLINAAGAGAGDRLASRSPGTSSPFGAIVFLVTTIRWIADTRRDIADLPLDHQHH